MDSEATELENAPGCAAQGCSDSEAPLHWSGTAGCRLPASVLVAEIRPAARPVNLPFETGLRAIVHRARPGCLPAKS